MCERYLLDLYFGEDLEAEIAFDGFDVRAGRRWEVLQDALELVDGARAGKERLPEEQLCEDTAERPEVHALRVPARQTEKA